MTGAGESRTPGLPSEICILPYAGLHEAIRLGSFHFWPWNSEEVRNRYLPEEELRDVIRIEVERHVNCFLRPVNTQCLVSFERNDAMDLASGAEEGIGAALAFLCFAHILPIMTSSPAVPETFQMFSVPIPSAGKPYAIASRGLHNLTSVISSDSVEALCFQKPREVDGLTMCQRRLACRFQPSVGAMCDGIEDVPPDRGVLEIGSALLGRLTESGAKRAFRAVRWHNLAMRQDDSLDMGQRAVAMATAFEILFDLGQSYSKAKRVCRKVDSLLTEEGTRLFRVMNQKGTKLLCEVTRTSYVAYKLYRWRNKVVHGDEYEIRDATLRVRGWDRKNLLLIASRVFGRCVKALYSD